MWKRIAAKVNVSLAITAVVVGAFYYIPALVRVEAATLTEIVVADAKTTHHLNLYVAQELGYFEKRNLKVKIVEVKDLAAARDALVTGSADVFWSCPTLAISAIANGAPLQIISQVKKPCTSVLVVDKKSPIKKYTDLRGKRIAGISPTCEAVIALASKARQAKSEFNLVKLAGGPAIAALEAKQIDGAILEEPHVSIAELKGYKVLFREASANIPCRTINARTAFIKSNDKAIKAFIGAIEEANRYILKDPASDRVVDIAHKYTGAPKDAIVHGNARLRFRTKIDEPGLAALGRELVAVGDIRSYPAKTIFAPSFKGITWGRR